MDEELGQLTTDIAPEIGFRKGQTIVEYQKCPNCGRRSDPANWIVNRSQARVKPGKRGDTLLLCGRSGDEGHCHGLLAFIVYEPYRGIAQKLELIPVVRLVSGPTGRFVVSEDGVFRWSKKAADIYAYADEKHARRRMGEDKLARSIEKPPQRMRRDREARSIVGAIRWEEDLMRRSGKPWSEWDRIAHFPVGNDYTELKRAQKLPKDKRPAFVDVPLRWQIVRIVGRKRTYQQVKVACPRCSTVNVVDILDLAKVFVRRPLDDSFGV